MFLQVSAFNTFEYRTRNWILDDMINWFFIFWGSGTLFAIVAASFSTSNVQWFQFLHVLTKAGCSGVFLDEKYNSRCGGVSHCGSDLHFSSDWWYWAAFLVWGSHWFIILGEMSIELLLLSFKVCCLFLVVKLYSLHSLQTLVFTWKYIYLTCTPEERMAITIILPLKTRTLGHAQRCMTSKYLFFH